MSDNLLETKQEITSLVEYDKINYVKVFVLLPVHNRKETTLRFIECLKEQFHKNLTLILIDDGSTDGTSDSVIESYDKTVIIRGNGNLWWAGALQKGMDWIRNNKVNSDDMVLIMNDDTTFEPDFISIGIKILLENKRALLTATGFNIKTSIPEDVGGYYLNWKNLNFIETFDLEKINCLSTRGLILRASDFLDIGRFHIKLLPHYLSDLEFTMRAQELGYKLIVKSEFKINIDFQLTGIRELDYKEDYIKFMKNMFSIRNAMNPVYWSSFVLLRSPWRYKLSNLVRIWLGGFLNTVINQSKKKLRRKYPLVFSVLKKTKNLRIRYIILISFVAFIISNALIIM